MKCDKCGAEMQIRRTYRVDEARERTSERFCPTQGCGYRETLHEIVVSSSTDDRYVTAYTHARRRRAHVNGQDEGAPEGAPSEQT